MKTVVRDSIVGIVNQAIDMVVASEKYVLDMYSFLVSGKYKRNEVKEFLDSATAGCISDEVKQLETYLNGGPEAADLREVYGWMGKPRARKFKDYLSKILEDANRYEQEKKPGRKRGSKVTNK
jgi:hypothetical protein